VLYYFEFILLKEDIRYTNERKDMAMNWTHFKESRWSHSKDSFGLESTRQ
jgi:hypothetical protein